MSFYNIIDASNDMGSYVLYQRRLLYKFFALSGDPSLPTFEIPGVKDYWNFENHFYGKVDKNFMPVVPNVGKLVQIEGQSGSVYVFDFVASAFERFKNYFQTPLRLGKILPGTPISDPVPVLGFENISSKYQNYLILFANAFNEYLFDNSLDRNIHTIKDYVKEFMNFYFFTNQILLRSTYYMSPRNPSYGSGLSLMIADWDTSDDKKKVEILSSPNFEFYRKAAINSGFIIDKNVPWRINIDLKSPLLRQNTKVDNIPFIDRVFSEFFSNAYENEISSVTETIYYGYRDFYDKVPQHEDEPDMVTPCSHEDLPPPSIQAVADSFPLTWWQAKYVEMKNKETGYPYNDQELSHIKRNVLKQVANPEYYINNKFRLPWLRDNSRVFEILRKEFEESGEKVLDNFSEHVKMIVMNSINSIY